MSIHVQFGSALVTEFALWTKNSLAERAMHDVAILQCDQENGWCFNAIYKLLSQDTGFPLSRTEDIGFA